MPNLSRAPNDRELERLQRIFLKAETDIINEIGRLRSRGFVDYHAVAALERVQAILRQLETDCWEYVPRMIEAQFYARVPEARKKLDVPDTPEKHLAAYQNARNLTSEQMDIVQRLTMNLMGEITDAGMTVVSSLQSALIGRVEPDIYRQVGLEQVAGMQAAGRSIQKTAPAFVEALRREGVTAFVDKAGRHWSLHTYGSMVCRTTSRQAEVLAVLTAVPEHDLYKISAHGTTCGLCAPYEGRVYSRSGADPDFPPLAAAFGKVDPNGPNDLSNTWLNIHPNCLHVILPWTPAGRSEKEIQEIKDFSNPKKNPFSVDPRTEKQADAYRKKEQARTKWLRDYRQWEQYRMTLGNACPKTFQTFQKHKLAGDETYKRWQRLYRTNVENRGPKGRSAGGGSGKPGIPEQIGVVDFSVEKSVLEQLQIGEKQTVGLNYEVNYTVTGDGKVWRVSGTSGQVNPLGIEAMGSSLRGSYSYHNHPPKKTWYSFSAEDVSFFMESGEAYSKASDDLYEYVMRRTPETLDVPGDVAYHRFKEIERTDVRLLSWEGKIDPDLDSFHEVMTRLSKEYRFDYVRRSKHGHQ